MDAVVEVLSWLCLLGGSFIVLVTGIGMLRLPTYYTRVHAASITDTMGAGLILLGLALQAGWSSVTIKLALILIFLVITGPPAAHALAKAAYLHGVKPDLPADAHHGEHDP
jgi:multicomponent Na+:H+ antiporter subunit G